MAALVAAEPDVPTLGSLAAEVILFWAKQRDADEVRQAIGHEAEALRQRHPELDDPLAAIAGGAEPLLRAEWALREGPTLGVSFEAYARARIRFATLERSMLSCTPGKPSPRP